MTPNGRRAWRKAARKLRCKMGRRWRSQREWVHGKRWSELVPDLEAHRAHITGTWFKRHGFQSFDAESSSRHYIGLWGSANGETIGFVESASEETEMTEQHTIHLPVIRYRDQAGQPTCAADFETGDVCKFYRTQRMGCGETCFFAETPEGSRYAQSMDRRDGVQGPGMGTLIPGDWCPVWEPTKTKRPA